ncbi:hypothetical protein [Fischerella thermalis]|uniref:hypothetical protein n=1 Tax=Fischerella thermalis TaxID=372787 RepID=UPI0011AEEE7B|nr:hypothetical protein [Fischerella thermalis]
MAQVFIIPVSFTVQKILFQSSNQYILQNSICQSRFWGYLKAELHWQNCSTLNQLRDRLGEIIEPLTPKQVNSLTAWDFIITA